VTPWGQRWRRGSRPYRHYRFPATGDQLRDERTLRPDRRHGARHHLFLPPATGRRCLLSLRQPGHREPVRPAVGGTGESAAPLWAMIHPDDLALSTRHHRIGADPDSLAGRFRVRHPTRADLVEGHSMPVREPDGGILWHGYVRTSRAQTAEQQLFATHERLQALMDALPVGVAFSEDAICQHITGNRTLLAHFEMTPQDNVSATAPIDGGRSPGALFPSGTRTPGGRIAPPAAVAERQVIPPLELEIRLPSGRRWLAEVTGAPLPMPKPGHRWPGRRRGHHRTQASRGSIAAALDEKEALLREVHHRVKNNLATLIDLLELQREARRTRRRFPSWPSCAIGSSRWR